MLAERFSILDWGKERLANWAQWALRDNPRLGYPKAVAWARWYQPEAGNVWDGENDDAPVDEIDAQRVELLIRRLPRERHRVVVAWYIERRQAKRIARDEGLTSVAVMRLLDDAAYWIGEH